MVRSFRGSAERLAWLTIDCTIYSVWYLMEYVNDQLGSGAYQSGGSPTL
jgi:hypothetical protein